MLLADGSGHKLADDDFHMVIDGEDTVVLGHLITT